MSHLVQIPKTSLEAHHWISGEWVPGAKTTVVTSPYTGTKIGDVSLAGCDDVDRGIAAAKAGGQAWASIPLKERTQVLFRFREILLRDLEPIANVIALESGKTLTEAKAGLMKGIEVLEFALSQQNLDQGGKMEVSRGVFCEIRREPLGVVAGITPFNFPAMVPMWMIPIALIVGNAFVWKPSEKTPLTSVWIAKALAEAGLPSGALTILQGGRETVEAVIDHPDVSALGFVGSSAVAKSVYQRATQLGKRALCLGGAKNPILLMPDANREVAVPGITASFTGCAGQRCMAASLLLAVGDGEPALDQIIDGIVDEAKKIDLGPGMGAIISRESLDRLNQAIDNAEKEGARILLDGRKAQAPQGLDGGYWLGPTILDQVKPESEAACTELFGPVLSIIRVKSLSEAMEIENSSDYGNACSVFTSQGGIPDEVASRARAGMIGVNIGVPVPREPFSFGGFYDSRFGHGDMTGQDGIRFWSQEKKVTTKWALQKDANWMS